MATEYGHRHKLGDTSDSKPVVSIDNALAAVREKLIDHVANKTTGVISIRITMRNGGVRGLVISEEVSLITGWPQPTL